MTEEAFHTGVIPAIALSRHALCDAQKTRGTKTRWTVRSVSQQMRDLIQALTARTVTLVDPSLFCPPFWVHLKPSLWLLDLKTEKFKNQNKTYSDEPR